MCGIVSIFSRNDQISVEALRSGMSKLNHRGPDSQKYWVSQNGSVGLGHTRLSIIDLSTGDQPLSDQDQGIHAVVNGELYGFEQIRQELEQKGHHFKTKSDSEIVLHLYKELGTQCLEYLRGEFAFTLWDEANQTFFAARDRFGIKPLFYSQIGETLYFASEVKALFAAGVPAHWDEEFLNQIHHSLSFLPGRSLYQNVFQIPPGHYLLATKNQVQIKPYWDFDYPTAESFKNQKFDLEETIEKLRAKLHESVKLRLRADVPVGCYLSGGLDSCSVLGIASLYSEKPIHAFTLSFDRPEYDELEVAREMAKNAKASFYPISVTESDLATNFAEALWHGETVFVNTHGVAKFLLSQAVQKEGYKVVLTGEGSDEIFAGYPHFRKDMLLHNTQGQDPDEIQNLMDQLYASNSVSQGLLITDKISERTQTLKRSLGFVPSFMEAFAQAGEAIEKLLRPEFRQKFAGHDALKKVLNEMDVSRQLKGRDAVHQSLYLSSKMPLAGYILSILGDRMEMGHSIEGRLPFLDHHFVESVVQLPVTFKIRGMTEKYILREIAKPVLTNTVYQRQKHPFLAPPVAARSQGPLFELMQDTLRGQALKDVPFYSRDQVIQLLDMLPDLDGQTRTTIDPLLMMVLSVTILQQKFSVSV